MNIFTTGDILKFAIRIEEDGEMFYRKAALSAKDKKVKDLFTFLADEEVGHKAIFEKMLAGVDANPPAETYSGEYNEYLQEYIDGKVVFTTTAEAEVMSDMSDVYSVLHFAMGREAYSILYYHEAKQFIDEKNYAAIDKIMEEERTHFSRLARMAEDYT